MTTIDVTRIVADCTRYWKETGVARRDVNTMAIELARHLEDSVAAGQEPAVVVGPDLASFAESWAVENRQRTSRRVTWEEVMSGHSQRARVRRRELLAYGAGATALVVAVAFAGKGDGTVDQEIWRWLWTGMAIVMGIGEIFTAGFFLLPFAIGAAAAAVLAWAGVNILAQWLVFFGVSIVSLAYLRRYIDRQDDDTPPRVGANRWVGATGIVLEEIDPDSGTGMVRIDNEEWRAASEHRVGIPPGARIVVRSVQGARLVVATLEEEI